MNKVTMATEEIIMAEALHRYPVLRINVGTAFSPIYEDVNEKRRSVFIEGATFGSNERKAPDCIVVKVNGIPLDRKDSIKETIKSFFTTTLNCRIHG